MNKILGFFLVVVLSNSIHAAQKVYAPFFEMINVHADYQYSSARLFKNYVDDQGKYTLVLPERHDSLFAQPSPELAQKTAQSLNCPYYLLGDMNRVGETVILNVALYESKDGSRVWGDRLKASGPEDLDPIFQKLARALGNSEKAAEAGDIYSVTDFESRDLRQTSAKNSFGIS